MDPYRVDVRPILEEIGGSVMVSDALAMGDLVVGNETFVPTAPADVSVMVTNAGGGLVATGSIVAHVKTTCSRCLCEFPLEIEGEVCGFYLRPGDEAAEGEDDVEAVDNDGAIDLAPALMASLVIEAPFAPLHDEECAGLCVTCGADLNTESCTCNDEPAPDHPFAGLKDLLGSDGSETDGD